MHFSQPSTRRLLMAVSIALLSAGAAYSNSIPEKQTYLEQLVVLPNKNFTTLVRSVEWPVGYKSAEHTHRGPGPRFVLSGVVEITENGVATRYAAGEAFWHIGGIPHTAENVADVPTKVLITEMLPL